MNVGILRISPARLAGISPETQYQRISALGLLPDGIKQPPESWEKKRFIPSCHSVVYRPTRHDFPEIVKTL
jgi:hypothetical protein